MTLPSTDSHLTPAPSTNADPQEIAKFSALAERWWDKDSEFKPLHLLNPLRLDYIITRCNGLFNKTVLDVGCGGGILTEGLAKQGAQVTGLDLAHDALQTAQLHAQQSGLSINYIEQAVEQHAQSHAAHYDVVTCLEMLEHVPDPASVITACATLVKPGGQLFFSTINRNIKAHLLAIVAAEYLLKLVPKGTHDSKKFITPAELNQWLRTNQLQARHITGIHYNPLTQHFSLHQDVSVNYLLHAEKIA